MERFTFIDRYFQSQSELLDIRNKEQRDINTLFSFLNNLHSLSDKISEQFDVRISDYPEFKLLRIIRNYFHHVGDINEQRIFVNLQPDVSAYHGEHIIIPMRVLAEAVNNFIEKNTFEESDKRHKSKLKFIHKEIDSILDICDIPDVLNDPKQFCRPLLLKCDEVVVELGFDIFKFIYNISNIIADVCKTFPELAVKTVIRDLEHSYCKENNIPKYDLMIRPGVKCILTTKGYIFPSNVARVGRKSAAPFAE